MAYARYKLQKDSSQFMLMLDPPPYLTLFKAWIEGEQLNLRWGDSNAVEVLNIPPDNQRMLADFLAGNFVENIGSITLRCGRVDFDFGDKHYYMVVNGLHFRTRCLFAAPKAFAEWLGEVAR